MKNKLKDLLPIILSIGGGILIVIGIILFMRFDINEGILFVGGGGISMMQSISHF